MNCHARVPQAQLNIKKAQEKKRNIQLNRKSSIFYENGNVNIDRESYEALLRKENKMCDLKQKLALLRSKCLQKFGKWENQ